VRPSLSAEVSDRKEGRGRTTGTEPDADRGQRAGGPKGRAAGRAHQGHGPADRRTGGPADRPRLKEPAFAGGTR